jgi:hypothetical protein
MADRMVEGMKDALGRGGYRAMTGRNRRNAEARDAAASGEIHPAHGGRDIETIITEAEQGAADLEKMKKNQSSDWHNY